jgi:hypothetical protein
MPIAPGCAGPLNHSLCPEVWEHSLGDKPPPASTFVSTVSNSALRSVSTAVAASVTPVVSPSPDSESVGFAAAPTIPAAATGGAATAPPLARQNAMAAPAPAVYVSIRWADRKFYVLDPEDEDEFSSDPYLCTADALPEEVTNERLLDFYRLEQRLEELQERYDDARSYLDSAPDPDEFRGRGIDRAERLYLRQRYEAALEEEAYLSNTLGRELAECEAEYRAAKRALEHDIFGPPPRYEADNTVYFITDNQGGLEIVGTGKSILECVPPREEPHEYFRGLHTAITADLPITNARLLEVWEAPAADKPELMAAVLADIATRKATGSFF